MFHHTFNASIPCSHLRVGRINQLIKHHIDDMFLLINAIQA